MERESASTPGLREEAFNWVAHEIKTPLSSAKINVQLMLRHASMDDKQHRLRAESVLRQLERMDALVNSVLEAAQLADGRVSLRLQPVELSGFLAELIAYWRDVRPEHEFALTVPSTPVALSLDSEKVRHILDNLISNAVKYGAPSKRIDVLLEESPGRAVIRVKDHGVGISASELPRIFNRFHRAEETSGSGHGLGLYIAAALARLHRGSLHAESEPGRGATFSLSLPRG
jgi:signal transduction histidine kinase